jgi:hypothetical protein
MAGPANRAAARLNGQLLVRHKGKAPLRPGQLAGEPDAALVDRSPDDVDMAGQMSQIAADLAAPTGQTAGPIDRTGRTLTLRLDGERHHALQMASRASGLSQHQLVLAAVDLWLSARKSRPTAVPKDS